MACLGGTGTAERASARDAHRSRGAPLEVVPSDHGLEYLSDNGGAYIAAETRVLARALGLKPINTPVCSPQSNSTAESFVKTFKRDYVSRERW